MVGLVLVNMPSSLSVAACPLHRAKCIQLAEVKRPWILTVLIALAGALSSVGYAILRLHFWERMATSTGIALYYYPKATIPLIKQYIA